MLILKDLFDIGLGAINRAEDSSHLQASINNTNRPFTPDSGIPIS